MSVLDKKNCIILNILQENCRASLTEIARRIGLSVDSTKKRIEKLINKDIFFPKIQLRPRNFGYKNIVDIKMKLNNYTPEQYSRFVDYLIKNPSVSEIFEISGEWNFSIVVIAKDAIDLGRITSSIRAHFWGTISDWSESLTTKVHKFEIYNVVELMENV